MISLVDALSQGLEICRVSADGHWGVLWALFLTGLAGSIGHCAGMCGPFVLSQVGAKLDGVPLGPMGEWHRMTGALALPYHLGRMTTYSLLGALAAGIVGHVAGGGTALHWLSALLLSVAALALLTTAFPAIAAQLFPHWEWEAKWAALITNRAKPLFQRPTGWRGFALGMMLGFIPCGLLYAALSSAASLGDALAGAMAMLAFTLGTVPALMAVGLAGHVAAGLWRRPIMMFSPWLMLANGLVLAGLASRTMWQIFDKGGIP